MFPKLFKRYFASLKIENPYTFEVIYNQTVSEVPYISYSDGEKCLESALKTFESFKRTKIEERISLVNSAMTYFEQNKEEVAKEITDQMGKPYKQSLKEVSTTISIAKNYASQAIQELAEEVIAETENSYKKVLKEPIGPVFLLSAYNYPLLAIVSSLIPAVLAGNPVIIKPSPYTPLSAFRFTKAFEGFQGVVQDCLLHTKDISKILQLPGISYVHLVGHSETGRTLYREIAHKSFIDIGLFLSSNNGVYVAEDANVGTSASQIIKSAMDNSGQSSYRYSRVFVHKSRYEEFLQLSEPLVMSYSIGDPLDDMTNLGPITEPDTIDTLVKSLEDAIGSGGQLLCGGNAVNDENGKGRFFEPTIVTGVDDSFPIMRVENFGPILIVDSVENDEEAVKRINGTDYGLIGGVYSDNRERLERIAMEINAGTVLANSAYAFDARMPMSGRKMSGRNTVYSHFSFRHFYQTKSVQVKFIV